MRTRVVLMVLVAAAVAAASPADAVWTLTQLCPANNIDVLGWPEHVFPGQFYGQLDGDVHLEILVRDSETPNDVYIYDGWDYSLEWSHTFAPGSHNVLYASICDTDGDGVQEVILITTNSVWVIDSGEPLGVPAQESNPRAPLSMSQGRPNPMSSVAQIDYQVGMAGRTVLRIYDVSGRLVKTLVDEPKPSGSYTARWDGRNDAGDDVASGTYFYWLENSGSNSAKKMIVLK